MNKHNKKQNIGILFDLFSSLYSDVLIRRNSNAISKLHEIFIKYFRNSELVHELKIYQQLSTPVKLTTEEAKEFLNLSVEKFKKLDKKKLQKLKYDFLNEVYKISPPKEFLSYPVSTYKKYATIYQILEIQSTGVTSDNYLKLNEYKNQIINDITTINEVTEEIKEKLSLFEVGNIIKFYKDKHYVFLNENQREILDAYLKTYNDKKLDSYLDGHRLKIQEVSDTIKDPLILKEIKNSIKQFNEVYLKLSTEDKIDKFLHLYSILDEAGK